MHRYTSSIKAFMIGIILIFSILALLFDSFKQPLIILVSVPFALIGVFSGFFIFWIPFSFPAMIGVIALIGIVVNDLIIMVECMNNHVRTGALVKDAAVLGMTERFRPIISTTLTTTAGLIPLGLSSPAWMPLCAAIIFGEALGTFIAIVIVPALFLLLTPERQVEKLA